MQKYLYNLATDEYRGLIPSIIKVFLFILSLIYGLVVGILILFYRLKPRRLPCKVISVGNITLGGTGKTTVVEYIVRYLKQQGHKVAILSRGYKRMVQGSGFRVQGHETMGDEPYMLYNKLSDVQIIVDSDRIRGANKAIKKYGVDTVILDDGFQQWKIKKDLEIVTIDSTNPFGNQRLIPRGILREPLTSLKRADIFILTKTNLMPNVVKQAVSLRHPEVTLQGDAAFGNPDVADIKDFLNQINPRAAVFQAIHHPIGFYAINKPDELLNTELLKNKTVTLFSGIGDPESFENLILNLGMNIGLSFKFRDHYNYTQKDLDKIIQRSQDKNINTVITTEKDAVRIYELRVTSYELRVLVLRIKLEIKDEQRFYPRLLGLYSA